MSRPHYFFYDGSYTLEKLIDHDWLKSSCNFQVTRVQITMKSTRSHLTYFEVGRNTPDN